jgi:phosphatidylserine/phosphatidylglycerophosphate/cardiolipin synthase-like enzyme
MSGLKMVNVRNVISYIELVGSRDNVAKMLRVKFSDTDDLVINYSDIKIHPALLIQIDKILVDEGVITNTPNGKQLIEVRAKEFYEYVDAIEMSKNHTWPPKQKRPQLFASPPELIPRKLAADIDDIRSLLINLIGNAKKSIVILSPYTTPAALRDILQPLFVSNKTKDIKVEVYIANSLENANKQIRSLAKILPEKFTKCIHFYYRSNDPRTDDSILHAKILIVDEDKGYLGSANFTEPGLQRHFELGIEMNTQQAKLASQMLKQLVHLKVFLRV